MTRALSRAIRLATFAWVVLSACDPDDPGYGPSPDGPGWQPPGSDDETTTGGATSTPGGNASGGSSSASPPIVPGMMPPPPDDAMPTSPGAGAPVPPPTGDPDLSRCAPPPAAASETAIEAWTLVNELRLAAGAGCMNMVPELNLSAQLHCDYRALNRGNDACGVSAHTEVDGCPGFTAESVEAREIKAGYPVELAYTEVALSYGDNPERAIPGWLVTPYHRIPILDPWTTDMGWGGGPGCDLINFGRGRAFVPDDTIVVYPYDGQTDVPLTFNGREAPAPPEPPGGWPSSYPVSIYAKDLNVTEHVLTKDGGDTPLEHRWLDSRSREVGFLRAYFNTTAILYGAPFEPNTTYRVRMAGTHAGGELNVEWTFTTGASRPFWF